MMLCFVQGNGEPSWWVITGNLKLHHTLEFPRELKKKKNYQMFWLHPERLIQVFRVGPTIGHYQKSSLGDFYMQPGSSISLL